MVMTYTKKRKLKTLTIEIIGKSVVLFVVIPRKKIYTVDVTGSRLSIRRAEAKCINDFMNEFKTGSCSVKSTLSV
jgi:hypothetical protein